MLEMRPDCEKCGTDLPGRLLPLTRGIQIGQQLGHLGLLGRELL